MPSSPSLSEGVGKGVGIGHMTGRKIGFRFESKVSMKLEISPF
jgi:hypothetical protein